jgi:hypothetical protein
MKKKGNNYWLFLNLTEHQFQISVSFNLLSIQKLMRPTKIEKYFGGELEMV